MANPNRIRQARELARLTQTQLAEAIGVKQAAIAQFESGTSQPTEITLEAIARELEFPVPFFQKEDPPNFPLGSLLFRKHTTVAAIDRSEVHRIGQLEYELAASLAQKVRIKPAFNLSQINLEQIERSYTPTQFIKEAAIATRSLFGFAPDQPIPNLIRTVEKTGAFVLLLPKHFDKCDAYSHWVSVDGSSMTASNKQPIIVLSNGFPGDRMRFTVAHELGHLILHQNLKWISTDVEDEANTFAQEFLLPEEIMRQQIESPVTLISLARLKLVWGVSIHALIMRAHSLGLITDRRKGVLFSQLSSEGWRKDEPLQLLQERPRVLRQLAEVLYGEPINYQKLAADLNFPPFKVKQIIDIYAPKYLGQQERNLASDITANGKITSFTNRNKNHNDLVTKRSKAWPELD